MILALLGLALLGPADVRDAALQKGDLEYARRAENAKGGTADPTRVEAAVLHYREALRADPSSRLARARLMRGLFFRASFCGAPAPLRLRLLEEARRLGDEGLRTLEADLPRAGASDADRTSRLRATP